MWWGEGGRQGQRGLAQKGNKIFPLVVFIYGAGSVFQVNSRNQGTRQVIQSTTDRATDFHSARNTTETGCARKTHLRLS